MACHHQHGPSQSAYPEQNYGPGAKWIKNLTKDRIGTFTGGHFSDVNLSSLLYTQRIDDQDHIKLEVWSAPGLSKPSFQEAMKQDYKPAKKGDSYGPSCNWLIVREGTNHWFKASLNIPSDWEKYERVQLEFDPGCEAMVYTVDGTPLQGITGGYGGDRRVEYIIPTEARKKGKHDLVLEVSCNGMFGVPWNGDIIMPPDMNKYFQLASADLVVPNQEAWGLLMDFGTLRELVDNLPGNSVLQNKALTVANKIMNVFHKNDPSTIGEARKLAEEVFGENWEKKGAKIYEDGTKEPQIWGIGHCHIDTAWLWPYSSTQQKVARSWSTQVDLMDRYPEHRFTCSQAQQYKWLEELYPPLFERVKQKVLEGKFHPVGGSWVENDANMPSGEALSRQFIFGQRFFESRFGKRCDTAWLPDSFGLTGALPQLIRLSGMDYFFTQKLSNNINVFPHSTFNWVGIDGTQVLCHMTPVDTYTAQATVGDVNKGQSNHKNLESNSTALLVFGNGDGGGGPLAKMLENLRRIRGTANESRELPPVIMGRSVDEFFEDVKDKSNGGDALPNWHGELYLEFHRGTYTSHASIKKGNRKSEIMLRDIEQLATMASVFRKDIYTYPWQRLNDDWEKVLLNQFHDVLPGSAIGMVYDDAEKLYGEVRKDVDDLIEDAFRVLVPSSVPLNEENLDKLTRASSLVGFNTTFFPRRDVITVPLTGQARVLGGSVLQTSKDGSEGYALFDGVQGGNLVSLGGLSTTASRVSVESDGSSHFVLQNGTLKMVVEDGRITSLYDQQLDRELITKGKTGGLIIFEDRPNYWDAWDVEIHHLEKWQELKFGSVKILAEGPLRASVQTEVKYGSSTLLISISLDAIPATMAANSRPMFTFKAEVDWHERHEFLKFELPLDIHSEVATYETPFGHVQRPTHKNTTWDAAKFEVCGHKFADLSEYGYGVAILSESKYGFSCQGDVLRISLLRAATAPDAEQDQGKHEFSWAVLPHEGHFLESDVPIAGYLFNSPLHVRFMPDGVAPPPGAPPSTFSLSGAKNVILETVKRGDLDSDKDGKRTVVLRLYEAYGGKARVNLHLHSTLNVAEAYTTNLLEDDAGAEKLEIATVQGGGVNVPLAFRGFEVKTVKLVLANEG